MSQYFRFFPVVEYGKFLAKNITANVRMDAKTKNNALLYHQYMLKEGDNAQTIAGKYYDSPDLDWLVYFANDIIDPYYDVYLSQDEFEQYIIQKYGTRERAQELTAGWINDWRNDDGEIAVAVYEALPSQLKKFYDPVLDYNRNLTAYRRSQTDMRTNTNRIIRWCLTAVLDVSNRSLIDVYASGEKIGSAEVVSAEGTDVNVQHVLLFDDEAPTHISIADDNTLVQIDEVLFDHKAIPDDEIPFWRNVSCYEAEFVANDAKKQIALVSNQYAGEFKRQFKEKLR